MYSSLLYLTSDKIFLTSNFSQTTVLRFIMNSLVCRIVLGLQIESHIASMHIYIYTWIGAHIKLLDYSIISLLEINRDIDVQKAQPIVYSTGYNYKTEQ